MMGARGAARSARDAVSLHHDEVGSGPPLLLGGSLGSTLAMWDANLDALAERHRVVRFDQRGHGGSPGPPGPYSMQDLGGDVLALMDLLGIERASYCGVSIGGMVGMWLAINAPERVNRLVLVCTSAHLPPASSWAERSTTVRAAGTTEVIADMILGRWLTAPFAAAHPDVAATLRAMLVSIEPEGYAAACSAIERMDLRDELAHVAAPTLVVSATHDTATPPDHGREIAMLVPGARFELVPGAHLANVECAREVSKFVLDHLREEA